MRISRITLPLLSKCSWLLILCLVLTSLTLTSHAQADLTIIQIGDSVADNNRNRIAADTVFSNAGIASTWIGDHSFPPTFGRGGIIYSGMLNGSVSQGALGLIDIIAGIENNVYATPDIIFLLGGYNNAFHEPANSSMTNSLNELRSILDLANSELPDTLIFVSNLTLLVGPSADRSSNGLALNALIAAEVASRDKVYLVDNYSILTATDLRADGLHPNDSTGQQKIGVNFANTVLAVPEPGTAAIVWTLLPLLIRRNRRAAD